MTQNENPSKKSTVRKHHWLVPKIIQSIAWPLFWLVLKVFMRLRVRGSKHLQEAITQARKEKRGILFVSNHVSELDFAFPFMGLIPFSRMFPIFFVVRDPQAYSSKKFGWRRHFYSNTLFLESWGGQPYTPGQNDYAKALPFHTLLLKDQHTVCIFPEGKYTHTGKTYKVRGGAGYLAHAANPIIVPVYIRGARGLTLTRLLKRKMYLTITYRPHLTVDEVSFQSEEPPMRYQKTAERIMSIVHNS